MGDSKKGRFSVEDALRLSYWHAGKMTRCPETRDDLAMIGAMGMLEAYANADPDGRPKAYAIRTGWGLMMKWAAKMRKWGIRFKVRLDLPDEDGNTMAAGLPDNEPKPEEKATANDSAKVINNILRGLGRRSRTVLDGYYRRGQSLKQIGEELGGLSAERVRQLRDGALFTARLRLSAAGLREEDLI